MNETTIQEYIIGEFRGTFPDVPIAAGVNLEELTEVDATPFFVTLPIIPEVGAISKNGLLYDDQLVNSIEEQINTKRPGGIFGHLRADQRDTAFPLPAGLWVGAKRAGSTLWAKAYIPPGAGRDHMRRLKAIGGQIATSIYGKGTKEAVRAGVNRLKSFSLESLDFAPPERAALGYGAAPIVTAELANQEHRSTMEITLNDVPQALRDQIVQEYKRQNEQRDDAAELATQLADRDTVIAAQQATIAEFQRVQFDSTLDAKINELINWTVTGEGAQAKVDSFKRTVKARILAEMGTERKADRIADVAATVWAEVQPIAETVRDALAGPPAIVAAAKRAQGKLEDTPEARAAAHASLGW